MRASNICDQIPGCLIMHAAHSRTAFIKVWLSSHLTGPAVREHKTHVTFNFVTEVSLAVGLLEGRLGFCEKQIVL